MTELASFECPHCGAKADKPPPGATTRCTFCEGELHSPEPHVREVIREVVREVEVRRDVVHEVVVTEEEARWARMSADDRARRRKLALIWSAIVFVAGVVMLLAIKQSADKDMKELEDKEARRQQCQTDCEKRCEATPIAAPTPTPANPSGDPYGDPYGDPIFQQQNKEVMDQMAKMNHDTDVTVCKAKCSCY
jgi:hypothetical protein